jgi:cell division protein ZapA (FtsZ GTPase activity inhibitor)
MTSNRFLELVGCEEGPENIEAAEDSSDGEESEGAQHISWRTVAVLGMAISSVVAILVVFEMQATGQETIARPAVALALHETPMRMLQSQAFTTALAKTTSSLLKIPDPDEMNSKTRAKWEAIVSSTVQGFLQNVTQQNPTVAEKLHGTQLTPSMNHTAFALLKHIRDKDLLRIGFDVAQAVKAGDLLGIGAIKRKVQKAMDGHRSVLQRLRDDIMPDRNFKDSGENSSMWNVLLHPEQRKVFTKMGGAEIEIVIDPPVPGGSEHANARRLVLNGKGYLSYDVGYEVPMLCSLTVPQIITAIMIAFFPEVGQYILFGISSSLALAGCLSVIGSVWGTITCGVGLLLTGVEALIIWIPGPNTGYTAEGPPSVGPVSNALAMKCSVADWDGVLVECPTPCMALVDGMTFNKAGPYTTCAHYCLLQGLECATASYTETLDSCVPSSPANCATDFTQRSEDLALCQCKPEL